MQYIRQQINKRSIFMMLLITLLCMTIIISAQTSSFWGKLGEMAKNAGTYLTFWQTGASLIKSLEEKIPKLQSKISCLEKKIEKLKEAVTNANREIELQQKRTETAAENLEAAQAATKTAETAKEQAETAYNTSVKYEKQAKLNWENYICDYPNDSCSNCGDLICYETERLHREWQRSVSEKAQDETDLEAAKKALTEKQKAEKEADKALKKAVKAGEHLQMMRDYYSNRERKTVNERDSKIAELIRKQAEYAENLSEVELAKVRFNTAVLEIKLIERTYPDQWESTLAEDPELAERIEEIYSQFDCPYCSEGCSACD